MQTPSMLAASTAPQPRNIVSIMLVGAIHIAVIYTLLVALEIVPSPVAPPPRPIIARLIEEQATTQRPSNPSTGPILSHPRSLSLPVPPPLQFRAPADELPSGAGPRAVVPANPQIGPTVAAQALAATHTIPPYPSLGIRFGHEGAVRLRIAIDEQGNATAAEVETSSGYQELDSAAIAWVKAHWRYQPAMQGGRAVSSATEAVVTFRLNQIRG